MEINVAFDKQTYEELVEVSKELNLNIQQTIEYFIKEYRIDKAHKNYQPIEITQEFMDDVWKEVGNVLCTESEIKRKSTKEIMEEMSKDSFWYD